MRTTIAAGVYAYWVVMAIEPVSRMTWVLENAIVLAAVVVIVLNLRRVVWSRTSVALVALFAVLHTTGSHYSYSAVPYEQWFAQWFPHSLGADPSAAQPDVSSRNHFDRVVHFCYGALLTVPIRQLYLQFRPRSRLSGYLVPLAFIASTSMFYELIEWAAAVILADASTNFVGSQGDPWDAHKDMALAMLGALLATLLASVGGWRSRHGRRRVGAADQVS